MSTKRIEMGNYEKNWGVKEEANQKSGMPWPDQGLPRTSFQESQYDRWSSRMPIIMSISSKYVDCFLCLRNRTDCYVWIRRKNLWLCVFEMHLITTKIRLYCR